MDEHRCYSIYSSPHINIYSKSFKFLSPFKKYNNYLKKNNIPLRPITFPLSFAQTYVCVYKRKMEINLKVCNSKNSKKDTTFRGSIYLYMILCQCFMVQFKTIFRAMLEGDVLSENNFHLKKRLRNFLVFYYHW